MLKRPCVISLTVASTALYVLEYPTAISRQTFRGFVLLLVISWAYDILTLFFIESSASEEDEEDGGAEYWLRRWTRLFAYITMFYKIIVILVFWKDSHDFRSIVQGKSSNRNEDEQIDDILA